MKKIVLFTVLCMILAFSVTSYAVVTETAGASFVAPDAFWNNGETLTWTKGTGANATTYTYAAGTLPYASNYMNQGTGAPNTGSRLLTVNDGNATSCAAPESESSSNVVFKMSGAGQTGIIDRVAIVAKSTNTPDNTLLPAPTRLYSAKVKLSTVEEGTTKLFVVCERGVTDLVESDMGVILANGGAYINNAATDEAEWFVQPGTLSAETWYTVETAVEIDASGNAVQDARIYSDAGTLLYRSGFRAVTIPTGTTQSSVGLQIISSGFATGNVMIDDLQGYKVTGTEKAEFTLTYDEIERDEIVLTSTVALDGDTVTTDSVKLNAAIDMTDKYAVEYDSAAKKIIITTEMALPFNSDYSVEFTDEVMISGADKYPVIDYTDESSTIHSFSIGADPFVVSSVSYDVAAETNAAAVTVANSSSIARDCMVIVASFGADGEYMETKCGYASIPANTVSQTVYAPPVTEIPGGRVCVMIWDNWNFMAYLGSGEVHVVNIPLQ